MSYKRIAPQPVVEGGTGVQATTTYAVLCGGTTTTNPIQSIASVGTAGQVLTSNGAGALPTFQAAGAGDVTSLTGNSGGAVAPTAGNINFVGDTVGITITGNPGTHTLTASLVGGGNAAQSFPTDSATATPTTGVLNIKAGNSTQVCGSTVLFKASTNTITLNVTDSSGNTIVGQGSGNATISGAFNTAAGSTAQQLLTSGAQNTSVGYGSLDQLLTGSNNIAVGYLSASNYTTSESSNIIIGALGTAAESNTIRLGTNGSGPGQQNKCFIAGVNGVNVGSTATVVTQASNQLGTAVITAGSGITITPGANTITISGSGTGSPTAFSAYLSTTQTGRTGSGTLYTVICDTEFYDIGSNYNNSTGTFTAPTTGRYQFTVTSSLNNVVSPVLRSVIQTVVTTSTNALVSQATGDSSNLLTVSSSIALPMTAGDTCVFKIKGTGSSLNDMDVLGASDGSGGTYFSGFLI